MKPEKLNLSVGGYMGASYSVEWKRGALLYKCGADRSSEEEKHKIMKKMEK